MRPWHTRPGSLAGGMGGNLRLEQAIARQPEPATVHRVRRSPTVTRPPWEYLFIPFNGHEFHDLFNGIWIASLVGLVAVLVLYNVRTRQLRRHGPYLALYEWLLWTGLVFFPLVFIEALFAFEFWTVLITIVTGCGVLLWIRFVRFPPELEAYERQLAKARYLSLKKYAHPEATIRPRASGRASRRRRR